MVGRPRVDDPALVARRVRLHRRGGSYGDHGAAGELLGFDVRVVGRVAPDDERAADCGVRLGRRPVDDGKRLPARETPSHQPALVDPDDVLIRDRGLILLTGPPGDQRSGPGAVVEPADVGAVGLGVAGVLPDRVVPVERRRHLVEVIWIDPLGGATRGGQDRGYRGRDKHCLTCHSVHPGPSSSSWLLATTGGRGRNRPLPTHRAYRRYLAIAVCVVAIVVCIDVTSHGHTGVENDCVARHQGSGRVAPNELDSRRSAWVERLRATGSPQPSR